MENLLIISDCYSLVKVIKSKCINRKSKYRFILERILNNIESTKQLGNNIKIIWIPSHIDEKLKSDKWKKKISEIRGEIEYDFPDSWDVMINGNNEVDKFAKEGLNKSKLSIDSVPYNYNNWVLCWENTPILSYKQLIREKLKLKHYQYIIEKSKFKGYQFVNSKISYLPFCKNSINNTSKFLFKLQLNMLFTPKMAYTKFNTIYCQYCSDHKNKVICDWFHLISNCKILNLHHDEFPVLNTYTFVLIVVKNVNIK